jgi:hypothetical protein
MLISNNSDFSDAIQETYTGTKTWDLCEGITVCENGTHSVYVKFYTSFGVGSSRVSDSIVLNIPQSIIQNEINGEIGSTTIPEVVNNTLETSASSSGGIISDIIGAIENLFGVGSTDEVATRNPTENITTTNTPRTVGESASENSNIPDTRSNGTISTSGKGRSVESLNNSNSNTSSQKGKINGTINSGRNNSGNNGGSKNLSLGNVAPFALPLFKDLAETRETPLVASPIVATVKKSFGDQSVSFGGKSIPRSKVALFIHSDQVVVYTTEADENGEWNFVHDQNNVELAQGEHTIFAVTYDPGSHVKSKPSVVQTFEVKRNLAAVALSFIDLPTTLLTLLVLLLAFGYLFRKKQNQDRV